MRESSVAIRRICVMVGIVLAMAGGFPRTATACLWDSDTLAQERAAFPTALELITGKFLRHSPEFYRWRLQDRQKKLAAEPQSPHVLAWLDDIGVAYDKLGDHDNAIATGKKALELDDNRYESHANLGTFYFHAGQYEAGLQHIDRALEINPNAHFGRERYQKYVVQWLLELKHGDPGADRSFIHTLKMNSGEGATIQEAVTGVLGMMRFGNHKSPVLLQVLAELLGSGSWRGSQGTPSAVQYGDAKQLAARALLMASYGVESDAEAGVFWRMAGEVLRMSTPGGEHMGELSLAQVEAQFKKELAEAEAWYEKVRADELAWISALVDVDAAFAAKYYEEPALADDVPLTETVPMNSPGAIFFVVGGMIVLALVGVVLWQRHRRSSPAV